MSIHNNFKFPRQRERCAVARRSRKENAGAVVLTGTEIQADREKEKLAAK